MREITNIVSIFLMHMVIKGGNNMIIFFEDGSITNNSLYVDGKEAFKVDAASGVTMNYNKLLVPNH